MPFWELQVPKYDGMTLKHSQLPATREELKRFSC